MGITFLAVLSDKLHDIMAIKHLAHYIEIVDTQQLQLSFLNISFVLLFVCLMTHLELNLNIFLYYDVYCHL